MENQWHRHSQPRPHIPHPKARGRHGTAPALTEAPGTKGLEESANFSPQLDLIFSSDAPTAGGGMAAEKQVRQGKSGTMAVSSRVGTHTSPRHGQAYSAPTEKNE